MLINFVHNLIPKDEKASLFQTPKSKRKPILGPINSSASQSPAKQPRIKIEKETPPPLPSCSGTENTKLFDPSTPPNSKGYSIPNPSRSIDVDSNPTQLFDNRFSSIPAETSPNTPSSSKFRKPISKSSFINESPLGTQINPRNIETIDLSSLPDETPSFESPTVNDRDQFQIIDKIKSRSVSPLSEIPDESFQEQRTEFVQPVAMEKAVGRYRSSGRIPSRSKGKGKAGN